MTEPEPEVCCKDALCVCWYQLEPDDTVEFEAVTDDDA